MGRLEVDLVIGLCLGAEPPEVLHEVVLERVVFNRAREPAARGLHVFHASLWIVWSPRPWLYPSPFSLLIISRSTTLLWRTAVPTCINSPSSGNGSERLRVRTMKEKDDQSQFSGAGNM